MTAFRATFSDMKLVKTRQVAQLIFEIPLSEFDAAYEVLGGMPNPASERWFGIAAIKEVKARPDQSPKPDRAKRDWRDLPPSQQAGIRSHEPMFEAFLRETRPDDWHETNNSDECLKLICGITSKSELGTNQKARVLWHQLDEQFQGWKALEHA